MRTRSFLPRLEYPRPDRQRSFLHGVDWLNLNGPWEFRFDPEDRGRDERWFDSDEQHWPDQVIVPFCWESLAAHWQKLTLRATIIFTPPVCIGTRSR
jgi:hypothetical protein